MDKGSGLPLFSYEFRPHMLFHPEIRGGIITSIMQVMEDTFGDQVQATRHVKYGQYVAIVAEGKHTYGVFFTYQTGPVYERFIVDLVNSFESKFGKALADKSWDGVVDTKQFEFTKECNQAFESLIKLDTEKLEKLLEILHSQSDYFFDDMLIYSRPEMSQIYTHLTSDRLASVGDEVAATIKQVLDLSNRTQFPINNFQLGLSGEFYALLWNVFPYAIVIFVEKKDLDLAHLRITEITDNFKEG
ncbi:MAG: hypothetical protein ACFFFG_09720 [Candidatus Thorarchaeota archaeon]